MERDFAICTRCKCGSVDLAASRSITTFDSDGVRAVRHGQLRCSVIRRERR